VKLNRIWKIVAPVFKSLSAVCFCINALIAVPTVHAEKTSVIEVPPLSSSQIDLLFDSLRSSTPLRLVASDVAPAVDPNVSGIWAGSKVSITSAVNEVVLRFRRKIEKLVAAAQGVGAMSAQTLESFDLTVRITERQTRLSHSHPASEADARGLSIDFFQLKPQTVAPFIPGVKGSGAYVAVLPTSNSSEQWGVFVCPRDVRSDPKRGLVFDPSVYELSEVKVRVVGRVEAQMSTAGNEGQMRTSVALSRDLPPSSLVSDEVKSARPWLQLEYRPKTDFEFFRFKPHSDVQQVLSFYVQMHNRAGHIRNQVFKRIVYVHRTEDPIGIPVFYGRTRPATDNGECYIVANHAYSRIEYDKRPVDF